MSSKKQRTSQLLKGAVGYRVTREHELAFVEKYLECLDCPRALTVWLLFRNGEHDQLVDLGFNPDGYNSPSTLRAAYAATNLLSKYKRLSLNRDPAVEAKRKFLRSEEKCKEVNARFRHRTSSVAGSSFCVVDPLYSGSNVWLHHAVRRKIHAILGEIDYEAFFTEADWGPGATTLMKRQVASAQNKFQLETGITRDLYSLLPSAVWDQQYPLWSKHLKTLGKFPSFQVGNKVITVPKNAKIDRVIAIEPGINLWFQKAIGEMLNKRLSWVGVDLKHQVKNQNLAYSGSLTSELATVDLASASDTISREVVRELLPPAWYHLMDLCRSHYGVLDNSRITWEKFSSMGNGFTFQLESLIFYACAVACTEYLNLGRNEVSIYGDDIILPSKAVQLLQQLLTFYGFELNVEKSFVTGFFRESCGAHFYAGFDVKPIYLKDRIEKLPAVYRFANAIRRQAHRIGNYRSCDSTLRPAFELLVRTVPTALRLRVPEGLGDGGFVSNFDEATPNRARHQVEGYLVPNLTDRSVTLPFDGEGLLLNSLWSLSKKEPDYLGLCTNTTKLEANREVFQLFAAKGLYSADAGLNKARGNEAPVHRTQLAISESLVPQWYDLGPWI